MKTAIIFTRVSSTGERQNTQRQVVDLKKYAQQNEFEIVKIFQEHISGATKNENRPILQEALDFCVSNRVDCVLLSELSRLSRNVYELQETIKFLIDNKINLYSQKEQINLLQNNGEPSIITPIIVSVLGTVGAIERENIKFRLNSGRQRYIANGGKLGRHKNSFKSIEKKKEEYKETISLIKRGYSLRNIAKITGDSLSTIMRLKKEFEL